MPDIRHPYSSNSLITKALPSRTLPIPSRTKDWGAPAVRANTGTDQGLSTPAVRANTGTDQGLWYPRRIGPCRIGQGLRAPRRTVHAGTDQGLRAPAVQVNAGQGRAGDEDISVSAHTLLPSFRKDCSLIPCGALPEVAEHHGYCRISRNAAVYA